jgi:hypothetical protein
MHFMILMAVMQISKPQTGNPGAEVRQPVPQSFWAAAEEAGQSRPGPGAPGLPPLPPGAQFGPAVEGTDW